ncbi:MAG: hypothetical protein JJU29_16330 [Verrucomicrobia bacterium]|nr:hypothetical protein [Verrucomicrobiota bacterium]MCH8513621.1 hypothetical protein [Kiritimatiellia bacterium]
MMKDRAYQLHHKLVGLCPMRRQKVMAGEHAFNVWSACNLDPLLEALSQKPSDHPDVMDERLPYWAELWPSASVMAETILSRPPPKATRWLELGCGPGLAGVAASRIGIPGIWTDYMREALWLAELNAMEEGVQNPETMLLDWREPPENLRVPWILTSDVAYEVRNFGPLLDCFDALLEPKGEIWFGEPGRPVAKDFFDHLDAAGWTWESLLQVGKISVYRLRRAA